MLKFLMISVVLVGNHGHKNHHDGEEMLNPVLPSLTGREIAAVNKFEDHKIFAQVWKDAGVKLADEIQEIREKKDISLRRRHKKHHHYE